MFITGVSILLGGISHLLYKSRITSFLKYTLGENKKLVAKYNKLVDSYNDTIDRLNKNNQYKHNNKSKTDVSPFEIGFYKECGKVIAKAGFEVLLALGGG